MATVKADLSEVETFSEVDSPLELLPRSINFTPSESYIVGFGIDQQITPTRDFQNLLEPVKNDAKDIANALTTSEKIPPQNSHIYSASEDIQFCNFTGMEQAFKMCAGQVGQDGLFVFYFSGHGSYKQGENTLVTTCGRHVTANDLVKWCNEANCKAKHTLFIFDCCLSGGVATKLVKLTVSGSLYVMTACKESQLVSNVQELQNSIFTFFLAYSINKHCGPRPSLMLPLREIFDESQLCSRALSDLIIRMDGKRRLEIMNIQPQSKVAQPPFKGGDNLSAETYHGDGSSFAYAYKLCRLPFNRIPKLHMATRIIVETWFMERGGAIHELKTRGFLQANRKVMTAALCCMMHSIATVEGALDPKKVEEVDLSIVAFLFIAIHLNNLIPGLDIPKGVFHIAWKKYKEALQCIGIAVQGFAQLQTILNNDAEFSVQQ